MCSLRHVSSSPSLLGIFIMKPDIVDGKRGACRVDIVSRLWAQACRIPLVLRISTVAHAWFLALLLFVSLTGCAQFGSGYGTV